MKLMDLLCSSNGSTAVTSSMHPLSTPTNRNQQLLRHVPCSSQFPINPKTNYQENHRKSTSSSSSSSEKKRHNNNNNNNMSDVMMTRRHSSVELSDLYSSNNNKDKNEGSSRRYLLGDAPFIDWVSSESDNNNKIHYSTVTPSSHHPAKSTHNLIRSSSVRSPNQVVVLWVSLHCKACEGKVRKHISKMEGVRSFSIERETKKVTIMGDVTPLGVLASVSKVKTAQLWPYHHNNINIPTSTSSSHSLHGPHNVL